MDTAPIRNEQEAQELCRRLEKFYGEPVLPLSRFCHAVETWMDCIVKNNTDPELSESGYHGRDYHQSLAQMRIDIRKSNLLGRLLYAKEPLRTRMCPIHKGHWSGDAMFFHPCPHLCDGTGWLRERQVDGGYTGGISIREARLDGKTLKIKDPHTGEWMEIPGDWEDFDDESEN